MLCTLNKRQFLAVFVSHTPLWFCTLHIATPMICSSFGTRTLPYIPLVETHYIYHHSSVFPLPLHITHYLYTSRHTCVVKVRSASLAVFINSDTSDSRVLEIYWIIRLACDHRIQSSVKKYHCLL